MNGYSRIVVGVDGSEESRKALEFACAAAAPSGADVVALATWTEPPVPVDPPFGSVPWGASSTMQEVVTRLVDGVVDEAQERHPDVKIHRQVEPGNAAQALIDASKDADLVVVGSRGHGGFAGMLLGSVSQHVAAHSACTVVVARLAATRRVAGVMRRPKATAQRRRPSVHED